MIAAKNVANRWYSQVAGLALIAFGITGLSLPAPTVALPSLEDKAILKLAAGGGQDRNRTAVSGRLRRSRYRMSSYPVAQFKFKSAGESMRKVLGAIGTLALVLGTVPAWAGQHSHGMSHNGGVPEDLPKT